MRVAEDGRLGGGGMGGGCLFVKVCEGGRDGLIGCVERVSRSG